MVVYNRSARGAQRESGLSALRSAALGFIGAVIAAALVASPGSVRAQGEATGILVAGERIEIEADRLALSEGGWEAIGGVRLRPASGGWVIEASRAALAGGELALEGARLSRGAVELEAVELRIDLASGTISGVGLWLRAPGGRGRPLVLRGASFAAREGALVVKGGSLAPFSPGGLVLEGEDLRIRGGASLLTGAGGLGGEEGLIEGSGVVAHVGGVPVAGWSGRTWPLNDRRSGLLVPEIGLLGGEGIFGKVGVFAPLGSAADATAWGFGASEGLLGGELSLRVAQVDGLDRGHVASLSVEGMGGAGLAGSALVEGSGAIDAVALPLARYDLALATRREGLARGRGPLGMRLGETSRSGLVLGPRGSGSALDAEVSLWQPLGAPGALFEQEGAGSTWVTRASYGLRGAIGAALADMDLTMERHAPAEGADVIGGGAGVFHRVGLGVGAAVPWSIGPYLRLRLGGQLGHEAEIFEVPSEEPTASVFTDAAIRQRMVGVFGLTADAALRSEGGVHRVRPSVGIFVAPVDRVFGDADAINPGRAFEVRRGGVSAQAVVGQRVGALSLDAGGVWASGVEEGGRDAIRLGIGVSSGASSSVGVSGALEVSPVVGGFLREARGSVWGRGGRSRARIGLARSSGGLRMGGAAWRASTQAPVWVDGVGGKGLTGVDLGMEVPVWPMEGLFFGIDGLIPAEAVGVSAEGSEISAAVRLGESGGGLRLELRVSRRAAPLETDAMLSGIYEGF